MSDPIIELEGIGAPVADTHAHLDMLADPVGALERAAVAGVTFIVTVADITEDAHVTFDSLEGWRAAAGERLAQRGLGEAPRVRIILGAHPHNASSFSSASEISMAEFVADPRVSAIGEIGLDYHYDHSPRDVQRDVFRRQLLGAHRCQLPAVVHLREAHDDGYEIMRDVGVPEEGCVLHCYTGDAARLERFLELGCYVSFAGPATFKKADEIRAAAAAVPLDRILIETDCPFMAPEPYRGRRNEPAFAVLTAARIAQARGMDPAAFARASTENAARVLNRER